VSKKLRERKNRRDKVEEGGEKNEDLYYNLIRNRLESLNLTMKALSM